jgi:hypothetical protein
MITPTTTCPPAYSAAISILPLRMSTNVSLPKVENVVNEPSKPIRRKARVSTEKYDLVSTRKVSSPIMKQPIRLTVAVPKGNIMDPERS